MPAVESGFLLIDKEKGWTSFDAVNKLRYMLKHHLGVKKIKVGHAGTLDPLATGLLIICYGRMTKEIDSFQGMEKVYTGLIKLGETTPSFDLETSVDNHFETDHINQEMVAKVAESMCGKQVQTAPMFSAKRVDGERLYKLAREGKQVKIKEHEIEIVSFEAELLEGNLVSFEIKCSKGTYIRTIANDFGIKLESGGHLQELRRISNGKYNVSNAFKISDIEKDKSILLK